MWNFNTDKTQERIQKLHKYYDKNGLNADNFFCKYFPSCSQSVNLREFKKQFSGTTAAVMPFYDSEFGGKEIRILIVGKEHGYMQNLEFGILPNFDSFNETVLNCVNWEKMNNHMKGTRDILKYIFEVDSNNVLSAYTLSDAYRCSFQKIDKFSNVSNVNSTKCMKNNCIKHLLAEIKILEPTLIITQGEWAVQGINNFVKTLEENLKQKAECLKSSFNKKYGLYKFDDFILMTTHHPAIYGHWKANLAPNSVWPFIDYLKENKYLPSNNQISSLESTNLFNDLTKNEIKKRTEHLPSNDGLRKERVKTKQLKIELNW